jgi:hypothetical protein
MVGCVDVGTTWRSIHHLDCRYNERWHTPDRLMCVRHRLMTSQPFHPRPRELTRCRRAKPNRRQSPRLAKQSAKSGCLARPTDICQRRFTLSAAFDFGLPVQSLQLVVTPWNEAALTLPDRQEFTELNSRNKRRIGGKSWQEKNASKNKSFHIHR